MSGWCASPVRRGSIGYCYFPFLPAFWLAVAEEKTVVDVAGAEGFLSALGLRFSLLLFWTLDMCGLSWLIDCVGLLGEGLSKDHTGAADGGRGRG